MNFKILENTDFCPQWLAKCPKDKFKPNRKAKEEKHLQVSLEN